MAKKEESNKDEQGDESKGSTSLVKTIIISAVVAIVVGGGVVAGNYFLVSSLIAEQMASMSGSNDGTDGEDGGADAVPMEPPQYLSMDPKFVVSFNDQQQSRFMQFSLEIMTRDSEVLKQVELHMPAIRSSLLMLFGIQAYQEMVTREGKEKLLQDVTADINTALQKASGNGEVTAAVEAAYFNSFVIQ